MDLLIFPIIIGATLVIYHSILSSFYLYEIKNILKEISESLSHQTNNSTD